MFGTSYASHPEILIQSWRGMNQRYRDNSPVFFRNLIKNLQFIYIRIFGIPEIGFQIRSLYLRKALSLIGGFSPQKILDVGSGIGSYVFYLAKLFPQACVEGWEIDKQKLAFTSKLKKEFGVKNVNFDYRDITQKQTGRKMYDFILAIDVLEHIKDYQQALRNIYALLKPNGYLYIHTPQKNQIRFFPQFRSWKHPDHVREGFNPKDFRYELSRVGYKTILMNYSFGYLGSLAWELNHLFLARNWLIAGLVYPFIYLLAIFDPQTKNKRGLGIAILAQK